jgi:hypothetical protein
MYTLLEKNFTLGLENGSRPHRWTKGGKKRFLSVLLVLMSQGGEKLDQLPTNQSALFNNIPDK